MECQLRVDEIEEGELDPWIADWREHVAPCTTSRVIGRERRRAARVAAQRGGSFQAPELDGVGERRNGHDAREQERDDGSNQAHDSRTAVACDTAAEQQPSRCEKRQRQAGERDARTVRGDDVGVMGVVVAFVPRGDACGRDEQRDGERPERDHNEVGDAKPAFERHAETVGNRWSEAKPPATF
jgi:hypothetical protein